MSIKCPIHIGAIDQETDKPVALPCGMFTFLFSKSLVFIRNFNIGHVFCEACLAQDMANHPTQYHCATCRKPYRTNKLKPVELFMEFGSSPLPSPSRGQGRRSFREYRVMQNLNAGDVSAEDLARAVLEMEEFARQAAESEDLQLTVCIFRFKNGLLILSGDAFQLIGRDVENSANTFREVIIPRLAELEKLRADAKETEKVIEDLEKKNKTQETDLENQAKRLRKQVTDLKNLQMKIKLEVEKVADCNRKFEVEVAKRQEAEARCKEWEEKYVKQAEQTAKFRGWNRSNKALVGYPIYACVIEGADYFLGGPEGGRCQKSESAGRGAPKEDRDFRTRIFEQVSVLKSCPMG